MCLLTIVEDKTSNKNYIQNAFYDWYNQVE